MKANILYIHGFGGSGNSRTAQALRNCLSENYNVFEPCFPINPVRAVELAKETIRTKGVDIVVASSLGGFTALQLNGVPKIVINPCLRPSKELSKLTDFSKNILQKFVEMEDQFKEKRRDINSRDYEGADSVETAWTYGVFSTKDELFSYKDDFLKYYGYYYSQTIEDTHHISVENVEKVIVPIIRKLENSSFVVWDEKLGQDVSYMGINYNGYDIEDLRRLANNPNPIIRVKVAGLLRTPADILAKLADDDNTNVRIRVANNKNTSISTLKKLSNDTNKWVVYSVITNCKTPNSIVKKKFYEILNFIRNEFEISNDYENEERYMLMLGITAIRRKFSDKIFLQLSSDEDEEIRSAIAQNVNTPIYILEKLSNDESDIVKEMAREELYRRN